jgi:glycosyltransferase involved in cell wall biosynthesis
VNICHITPIYSPGTLFGSSRYVQDISNRLARKGHLLTVLTANAITGRGWVDPLFGKYSSEKEEMINGVRVKRLKTRWQITSTMFLLKRIGGWFLPDSIGNIVSFLSAGPYLSNLKKEFQNERYGAIHVTPSPYALVYLVWRACKALRIPFVCSPFIHFEDPRFKNPLLWKVLEDATFVIACTHYEKERMIRMGIDPSKIHLIPMGIDSNEWENADGERFRRKYRLKGKKIILFAGPKGYDKGILHLLNAVQRLKQKMEDLVLVSIGLPTRMWRKKKRMLDESNLLDLGYLNEEEKRDAFAACDIFVLPSRYDSFGIVYLEAWRCGKPVIGAKVGAIPEVIEEGRDGLLVEFGDVEQLTSKMLYLLNHPDLCKEMGENGRRKVVERFNWEKNIEIVENVFKKAKIEWR